MAVQITQSVPENKVLNAYNNNIAIFKTTDLNSPAIRATITVDGIPLSITPAVNGDFTYNFKQIFKIIINQNYFRDGITGSDVVDTGIAAYVLEDTFVYKEVQVDYKIFLENGTEETTVKNYKIMRAVDQLEEHRRSLLNSNNTSFAILLPFTTKSSQHYHATYFQGLPFDIPLYSDSDRQVTITNVRTGNTASVNVKRGVNRVFVSNGNTNWSIEDILALPDGLNELEFSFTGLPAQKRLTLYLTKTQKSCGTYLKWFNQQGGWSYFLFNTHKENRSFKSVGSFGQGFDRLEDTVEQNVNLGMTVQDSIRLFYAGADDIQKKNINTLFESPKIYRLLISPFQNAQHNDWIAETVKNGSIETYNKNKHIYEDSFTISKSKRIKMTM